jgi:hypothetical protein
MIDEQQSTAEAVGSWTGDMFLLESKHINKKESEKRATDRMV